MATELKRTTIYLPCDLRRKLDELKKEKYWNTSTSAMISELIRAGVEAEQKENAQLGETNWQGELRPRKEARTCART